MTLAVTKCQICEVQFENPSDLQVHFQTEHVCMRDGSHIVCPNSYCEKVYPSKESLRTHLMSHYRKPSLFTANADDEFNPLTHQCAQSPSEALNNGGVAPQPSRKTSKTANTAPKHSPGAPEESHTGLGGVITVKRRILDTSHPILKCNRCDQQFNDADQLQHHVASHFARPHVCRICDAGFTTFQALEYHSSTHSN